MEPCPPPPVMWTGSAGRRWGPSPEAAEASAERDGGGAVPQWDASLRHRLIKPCSLARMRGPCPPNRTVTDRDHEHQRDRGRRRYAQADLWRKQTGCVRLGRKCERPGTGCVAVETGLPVDILSPGAMVSSRV
ncbi:hypothetical protein SKAU_G00301340 [Synaphobranchus kaupii]|uniref:Uncharacterized protein n=1 Tax=Synaphobranchus kaupii TaxID=118154 RepID=A0A9Q1INC3_SYNKA|nr:hypothetical protein SKAU_G00301340 [Synaphobranchus kaupii]